VEKPPLPAGVQPCAVVSGVRRQEIGSGNHDRSTTVLSCMPDLRRHLADALSAANAFFGILSCVAALSGRADVSLLLLIAGAVCDGLDGAAARRFGGTRFGVLADDVADAISYGIAPAIAVAVVTQGLAGTVVGVVYGALTLTRLVYFTLHKGLPGDDPRVFRGLPSTVGAVIALSAAILWSQTPVLVAFAAGAAVALMVGFDAGFLHPGRALQALPRQQQVRLVVVVAAVLGLALWSGPAVLATVALVAAGGYALTPPLSAFQRVLDARRA
jgi:CDP-diacylglycerol--serine O-phosphatidyltransferase